MTKQKLKIAFGTVMIFVVLVLVLQFVVTVFKIPAYVLPAPSRVWKAAVNNFGGTLGPSWLITIRCVVIGYLIGAPLGIILAAVLSSFKMLEATISPIVTTLVCTPLISLVPLLMVYMGYGLDVRILAVVIQTFPIVNMNSFTGFCNVDKTRLELMKSLNAGRITTFARVTLPDALPHVFTGLKLGMVLATIGAISTEIVGGNSGLGFVIVDAKGLMKTDLMLAAVLCCAITGIVLYTLINLLEKKIIKWQI